MIFSLLYTCFLLPKSSADIEVIELVGVIQIKLLVCQLF